MKITATSTNRNLISTTISIISTINLLLLLLVREVVIIPRVPRVCVSHGFRALCAFAFRAGSARVVLLGFHARCRIQISLRKNHI